LRLPNPEGIDLHSLHHKRLYVFHRRKRRPLVQPPLEYRKRVNRAVCKYLDTAILQIDRVPGNPEALGLSTRAVSKPHALNTAMYRELSSFLGHAGVS